MKIFTLSWVPSLLVLLISQCLGSGIYHDFKLRWGNTSSVTMAYLSETQQTAKGLINNPQDVSLEERLNYINAFQKKIEYMKEKQTMLRNAWTQLRSIQDPYVRNDPREIMQLKKLEEELTIACAHAKFHVYAERTLAHNSKFVPKLFYTTNYAHNFLNNFSNFESKEIQKKIAFINKRLNELDPIKHAWERKWEAICLELELPKTTPKPSQLSTTILNIATLHDIGRHAQVNVIRLNNI